MACLSFSAPRAVYFVSPASSAALAASLMNAGVSKSGSPAAKAITSCPASFICLARRVTASVAEAPTCEIRSDSSIVSPAKKFTTEVTESTEQRTQTAKKRQEKTKEVMAAEGDEDR